MFKNLAGALLLVAISFTSFSQRSTAASTKKLLTGYEWELKYVLKNGQQESVPEGEDQVFPY